MGQGVTPAPGTKGGLPGQGHRGFREHGCPIGHVSGHHPAEARGRN